MAPCIHIVYTWALKGLLYPGGSIYTTIMESGPQNHSGDGLLGPTSMTVVYMDPLGIGILGPKCIAYGYMEP